ncbi:hypothetical protein N781_13950 [Pontibacillus halophilus JSM 076056 = DSM 19796]|uniref:VOC domain-containing protein n=1 Tax=Pontibacillus halophilus JSM 076056 = DSM 19796 TaxID=1385510 RepID=A0A0A5GLX1_9BACI|nr:hypothetical protein N781_13950 [Pontibacillus halophilus JSM 076056 = DSM 19796]
MVNVGTIEIPVEQLDESIQFYTEMLGLTTLQKGEESCMLTFNQHGAPNLFLVKSEQFQPLHFESSHIKNNSIIDFYTTDLDTCHRVFSDAGIEVTSLNKTDSGLGGFGFKDPNGHWLGMHNVSNQS